MSEHGGRDEGVTEFERDAEQDKGRLGEEHWPSLCDALAPLANAELIEHLVEVIEAEGGFRPTKPPLNDHRRLEQSATTGKWYAIQNSELEFIKDATAWLSALMDLTLTKGIATAGKVIAFGLNYLNKRIELTPLQSLVLRALCDLPGKRGTVEEIAATAGLSSERVAGGLQSALALRFRKTNKPATLIEQDGDIWLALDL